MQTRSGIYVNLSAREVVAYACSLGTVSYLYRGVLLAPRRWLSQSRAVSDVSTHASRLHTPLCSLGILFLVEIVSSALFPPTCSQFRRRSTDTTAGSEYCRQTSVPVIAATCPVPDGVCGCIIVILLSLPGSFTLYCSLSCSGSIIFSHVY